MIDILKLDVGSSLINNRNPELLDIDTLFHINGYPGVAAVNDAWTVRKCRSEEFVPLYKDYGWLNKGEIEYCPLAEYLGVEIDCQQYGDTPKRRILEVLYQIKLKEQASSDKVSANQPQGIAEANTVTR